MKLSFALSVILASASFAGESVQVVRTPLPALPTSNALAGVVSNTVILASTDVWALNLEASAPAWAKLNVTMQPVAMAVGEGGLFCVEATQVLKLMPTGDVALRLPLPEPVKAAQAAVMSKKLYIVGERSFALDLTTLKWETVAIPATNAAIVAVRKDETAYKDALFVFGPVCGRFVPGDKSREGWQPMPDLPAGLRPTSVAPLGPAHLVVTTDDGRLMLYHTYTGKWVEKADVNKPGIVSSTDGPIVWLGDEAAQLEFKYRGRQFGWVDFTVVILYMAGMIGIGEYFRKKEKTAKDFLLAGQRIPWWAAGLSIWATGVSAISYMAIPAKTYSFDWSYVSLGIWPPLTTAIVAYAFIPLLRRLQIVSITEYMELRFGLSVRVPTTILTIMGGVLGRLATVLLLPSLALSAVTGWPVWVSIVAMGVITTIYTVAGGMGAVIWTDVAQTVVMFGGAILSLVLVLMNVDSGLASTWHIAMDAEKLRTFDFAWDFSVATFWVFILWAFADMWGKLGQEGLQRAFSTKDVKSAQRAMITCAVISIPGTVLFYGIGTALFAFYHQHPANLNPNLPTDSIFPLFIMQQLPTGVAGLVIAGIFAAAMSTLSGMNSYATIVVQDFCAYFGKDTPDHKRLVAARWVTLLYGVMATAGAWYLSTWKVSSLWDTVSKVVTLMGGGGGCVMVLALLTKRANTFGVWVGIITGTVAMWTIELMKWPISFFIYGTIALAVSCVTGYIASIATGGSKKDLTGLTLWTLPK
jgi:SSS family transporter